MGLKRLAIRNVRNLGFVEIEPAAGINIVVGRNGSGKSSLLEAIHLLGLSASFRTSDKKRIIRSGQTALSVHGTITNQWERDVPIDYRLTRARTEIEVENRPVVRATELVSHLPITFIGPEDHQIFERGPKARRKFIDWGVFHVEPSYIDTWKNYHRVLRHRNAALKRGDSPAIWDTEFVRWANNITERRRHFLSELERLFSAVAKSSGWSASVNLVLNRGWPDDTDIRDVLSKRISADREKGFTVCGPHTADLEFVVDGRKANDYLSRGQKKMLAYFLKVAQALLVREFRGHGGVVLVDDLPSELDKDTRLLVQTLLYNSALQVFVTTTDAALLDVDAKEIPRTFHVEQGNVTMLSP